MCRFAYCFSASAMRGWFSLVKTDVWRAGEIFSFGSRDWHSQIQVETFQHQIRLWASRKEIPTGPVWFWDFRWRGCFLILWLFQIVGFHWIEDWFSFEIGFSKEKEFTFLNRESLDQVSNSKAPFVFVLDFLMAENQQPENTASVEEAEVPPAPEAEAEAVPKTGSPVPPIEKTTTPELTESPELVATMEVEFITDLLQMIDLIRKTWSHMPQQIQLLHGNLLHLNIASLWNGSLCFQTQQHHFDQLWSSLLTF